VARFQAIEMNTIKNEDRETRKAFAARSGSRSRNPTMWHDAKKREQNDEGADG